ncbi:ComF family protein [Desulfurobacterium atlanticum]|uniref:ComF family protein n=1 Tax=Desulfurobacterium atlanticum TaxID=240169 RepID=A0A238XRZ3_9BACT|nr:ComF family protein [Desulfurobacterium atlanticum]SNR61281.1 comF family protein [Desulfurobacterium atlanticum]
MCGRYLFVNHKKVACNLCWRLYFKPFLDKKCEVCGYPLRLSPGCEPLCGECFRGRSFNFDAVDYFTLYDGIVEIAIKKLKFEFRRDIAEVLGDGIKLHLCKFLKKKKVDFVVPVPLHPDELKVRGFNQCELILRGAKIPFVSGVVRLYPGKRQSTLGKKERRENVRGLFGLEKGIDFRGKTVCIFDDIFTTGSTADEIARLLKDSGAKRVVVYTLARATTLK